MRVVSRPRRMAPFSLRPLRPLISSLAMISGSPRVIHTALGSSVAPVNGERRAWKRRSGTATSWCAQTAPTAVRASSSETTRRSSFCNLSKSEDWRHTRPSWRRLGEESMRLGVILYSITTTYVLAVTHLLRCDNATNTIGWNPGRKGAENGERRTDNAPTCSCGSVRQL